MKTLRILLMASSALMPAASAIAVETAITSPRIKDNGDVSLTKDLKIGRWQNNKFISQPDAVQIGSIADPDKRSPLYSNLREATDVGPYVFGPSHVMVVTKLQGGTGNREAIHAEANSHGGIAGEQIVGGIGLGRIIDGSGTAYGWNPYCLVSASADSTAQCIGEETDVDAQRDVNAKIGLQIVDIATSVGKGTVFDAGILVGSQVGGRGFQTGFQFGYGVGETQYGIATDGKLINAMGTALQFRAGIDFSEIHNPFSDAAIKLSAGNRMIFGTDGIGGSIQSLTGSDGGRLLFGTGITAIDFSGGQQHIFSAGSYQLSVGNKINFGTDGAGGSVQSLTGAGAGRLFFGNGLTSIDFNGAQQHRFAADGYTTTGYIREATPFTPSSSSSPCLPGQHSWDTNYEYRCVATNSWKRVSLSSW